MDGPKTTWLVLNPASGSNDEQTVAELLEALRQAGHAPQRTIEVPGEDSPDRAALESAGVDLLVVFTGDGTANHIVTGLYGWAGEVLVLPGGTQNLLARRLHGERPAAEIVAALGDGALGPTRLRLVRCSAGDALVEIVAGPGATWSEVRESLRDGGVGEIAAATRDALGNSADGPMVTVIEPPLGKIEGYPAIRLWPSGDAMAVDGYGADGILDYARQGLALLQRDFRAGPHDELGLHHAVVCRSGRPIALMLDGERADGDEEERFEVSECDVHFLAGDAR